MTIKEIIAEADEVKAMLQALAGQKIGWGMDAHARRFLKVAFKFVQNQQDLARQVEKLSDSVDKLKSESNPIGEN